MKNITIYHVPNGIKGVTAAKLAKHPCPECPKTERLSAGFVPADNEGNYLVSIGAQHHLFAVEFQTRRVDSKAVKREAQKRLNGQPYGRKQMREMIESVGLEFLAKTLPSPKTVTAWLDCVNNRLMVDTTSASVAELVVSKLTDAVDGLNFELPNREDLPVRLKSFMLDDSAIPDGFDRGDSVVIKSKKEDSSRAAYKIFNLFGLNGEILLNSDVIELGMIYSATDFPSTFTLTSTGLIKGLKLDTNPEGEVHADFLIFAETVAPMLNKLFDTSEAMNYIRASA